MNGQIENSAGASPVILRNEPVRVYDTSGPWGDPDFHGDVTQGLPPLRAKWIRERGDVEEIDGRRVQPIDDGFLSEKHARLGGATSPKALPNAFGERVPPLSRQRKPLRARAGCAVTQLAYARRGIITPEMEFIAIRENMGSAGGSRVKSRSGGAPASPNGSVTSNDLRHQHRLSDGRHRDYRERLRRGRHRAAPGLVDPAARLRRGPGHHAADRRLRRRHQPAHRRHLRYSGPAGQL